MLLVVSFPNSHLYFMVRLCDRKLHPSLFGRLSPTPPWIKISACLCLREQRVTRSRTQHHKTFSEFPQIWLPSLFISFVLTLRTSDSRHIRSERASSSPEQEFSMSFAAEVINGALSDILCPLDNRNLNTKTLSHRRAPHRIDDERSRKLTHHVANHETTS